MSGNNETKQVYVRWTGIRRGEPWVSAPSGPWGAVLAGGEAVFCDADYVELGRKTKGMEDYEGICDLEMYVAELQAGHLLPYNPMIAVRREIAESPAEISAAAEQPDAGPFAGIPLSEYRRLRKVEAAATFCLGYLASAAETDRTKADFIGTLDVVERRLREATADTQDAEGEVANDRA